MIEYDSAITGTDMHIMQIMMIIWEFTGKRQSLYQSQIRYDTRKYSFSNRIMPLWNSLPLCQKKLFHPKQWVVNDLATLRSSYVTKKKTKKNFSSVCDHEIEDFTREMLHQRDDFSSEMIHSRDTWRIKAAW